MFNHHLHRMKRTHDLHATVSEWRDEATGKRCKRTVVIGSIFVSSHGNQVIKLEAVPLSRDWSGWVSVKPCAPALPDGRRQPRGMPPPPPATDGDNSDDDVPF
jgi:hypothetical protein